MLLDFAYLTAGYSVTCPCTFVFFRPNFITICLLLLRTPYYYWLILPEQQLCPLTTRKLLRFLLHFHCDGTNRQLELKFWTTLGAAEESRTPFRIQGLWRSCQTTKIKKDSHHTAKLVIRWNDCDIQVHNWPPFIQSHRRWVTNKTNHRPPWEIWPITGLCREYLPIIGLWVT